MFVCLQTAVELKATAAQAAIVDKELIRMQRSFSVAEENLARSTAKNTQLELELEALVSYNLYCSICASLCVQLLCYVYV